jgi:integrase
MTVYFDKSKKRSPWCAEVTKRHVDGRELTRKKFTATQEEAKGAERELEKQLIDELYYPERIQKRAPKLKDFLPKFLTWYTTNATKQSTAEARERQLTRYVLPPLGSKALDAIQAPEIEALHAYIKRQGITNHATINGPLGALSLVLDYANKLGLILTKPMIKLLAVTAPESDCLSDLENTQLLRAVDAPIWEAACRLAGESSAMRRNEILGLQWLDVNWQESILNVKRQLFRGGETLPKNGKPRDVPLSAATIDALKALKPKYSGRIFPNLTESTMSYNIVRLSRLAGLRQIGWHTLRHTALTRMARNGTPLHVLMRIAGHESLEVTKKYLHSFKADLQEAASKIDEMANKTPQRVGNVESLTESWLGELLNARSGSKNAPLSSLEKPATYQETPLKEPSAPFSLASFGDVSFSLVSSGELPISLSGDFLPKVWGVMTSEGLAYSFLELSELQELGGAL